MRLTRKIAAEFFDYNPRTGVIKYKKRARKWFRDDRLWKAWNAQWAGNEAKVREPTGYVAVSIYPKYYLAHRVAWLIMTGEWPSDEIDHKNGDRADNRWRNLREADRVANSRNQFMRTNNTSGVNGVTWWKPGQLWVAQVAIKGRRKTTYHHSFDEAVASRKRMDREFGFTERHGERKAA